MKKQTEFEGMSTGLSNACSDYAEAYDKFRKSKKEYQADKDALSCAGERVADEMIKVGMDVCHHDGLTIAVKRTKKPNVSATEDK